MTMDVRSLRPQERALLTAMLKDKPHGARILDRLDAYKVVDMEDDGTGSVRVIPSTDTKQLYAGAIATAEFADVDGVPLLVSVHMDESGELFEIDIWKVDYSPLKKYPSP